MLRRKCAGVNPVSLSMGGKSRRRLIIKINGLGGFCTDMYQSLVKAYSTCNIGGDIKNEKTRP